MNTLEDLILAEHSKNQKDRIIEFIKDDSKKIKQLMVLFFEGEPKVKQRASYVVGSIEDIYPKVLKKYYPQIVMNLKKEKLHNSIPRNSLRILTDAPLDEEHTGILLDLCFGYLEDNSLPVAIRAFSITCLYEHGNKYPELMTELKLILEDHLPFAKPAYKFRAKAVIKEIDKKAKG